MQTRSTMNSNQLKSYRKQATPMNASFGGNRDFVRVIYLFSENWILNLQIRAIEEENNLGESKNKENSVMSKFWSPFWLLFSAPYPSLLLRKWYNVKNFLHVIVNLMEENFANWSFLQRRKISLYHAQQFQTFSWRRDCGSWPIPVLINSGFIALFAQGIIFWVWQWKS